MAYIGNGPGVASQRIVSTFEPTTDTTTFSPSSGYTVGYVDVYLNGVKLQNGTDFTASNGTSVVLTDAAVSGDFVEILAFIPRGLSDGYTKSEAETKFLDATSNLSDIGTPATARTNLGLGTAATTDSTAYATAAQGTKADSAVQNLSDLSITATAAEINKLDGVTATTAELNYTDGVTSNIQTQLDGKATAAQGALADSAVQDLSDLSITATASEINKLDGVTATTTELNYVDGVTSNVQTQINSKQDTLTSGDISTALIADGAVTNAKLASGISSSKLSGALPALDGSALTGIDSLPSQTGNSGKYLTTDGSSASWDDVTVYEQSNTDPTISTNPSGGVGSLWVNYSSKKIYVCYDATAGANKWQNIHDSSDVIVPNTAPTNPTNTSSFPSSKNNGDTFTFTFSGATDTTGSVTHYLVDNFSSSNLTVSSAEVSAGSAHSFTVANISSDDNFSFRVRAKDQYGLYSSGVTINITLVAALYMAASGGSVVTSGDYKIHTFTSSGTFTVSDSGNSAGSNSVQFLVIAGGGGGGQDRGGGGGAGGYRRGGSTETSGGGASAESELVVSTGNYTVTIGGGGSGAPNESTAAGAGSNSVFGSITSIGGGRGGNGATGNNGGNGGSGGGAKSGTGGSGTTGQGYAGASGGTGLGGGGAAGVGTSSGDPRSGGPGRASSITGSSVTRAAGGRGANDATNNDPAGAANSGNGGPGGGYPGYQQAGKAGGSGLVVIKYKFQ